MRALFGEEVQLRCRVPLRSKRIEATIQQLANVVVQTA